jgi:ParB family chromosome partitioning protein
MRHDLHYVDALAASSGAPVGRLIPIEQLDPNPDQPRQVMGDLSELMASIAEKGIIEPLIVRQRADRFQIIAGERRYQAAAQVGLGEVPVIIRDVDDGELIEIALIENIQRKNLTPFEEAEAIQSLGDTFNYTHEELARRLGKARTSITESFALSSMSDEVKSLCRLAEINAKSVLVQVARQPGKQAMLKFVEQITLAGGITRADARKVTASPSRGRPKSFVFKYAAPSKAFKLQLNFRKAKVGRSELIKALEDILNELRDG